MKLPISSPRWAIHVISAPSISSSFRGADGGARLSCDMHDLIDAPDERQHALKPRRAYDAEEIPNAAARIHDYFCALHAMRRKMGHDACAKCRAAARLRVLRYTERAHGLAEITYNTAVATNSDDFSARHHVARAATWRCHWRAQRRTGRRHANNTAARTRAISVNMNYMATRH